jgi:hypothetical protein
VVLSREVLYFSNFKMAASAVCVKELHVLKNDNENSKEKYLERTKNL